MIRWSAMSMAFTVASFLFSCAAQHKTAANTTASSTPASLVGTEWILQDLAGTPVVADSKASLAFPEAGRATGNGSCNRFTGTVNISGSTIKFGPLASTRMACLSVPISNQEMQYLKALDAAARFEVQDAVLLIYLQGFDKPLRFAKGAPSTTQ